MPKYYYVPEESIADERAKPGSSYRMVSDEGSSSKNVYLWGQAMLIISDLLATSLLMVSSCSVVILNRQVKHETSISGARSRSHKKTFAVRDEA